MPDQQPTVAPVTGGTRGIGLAIATTLPPTGTGQTLSVSGGLPMA